MNWDGHESALVLDVLRLRAGNGLRQLSISSSLNSTCRGRQLPESSLRLVLNVLIRTLKGSTKPIKQNRLAIDMHTLFTQQPTSASDELGTGTRSGS